MFKENPWCIAWKVKVKSFSRIWLFATPRTVAYQAPPSMEFSWQEYWSGLPFPSAGDLPKPGIQPGSPALQADSLLYEPQGSCLALYCLVLCKKVFKLLIFQVFLRHYYSHFFLRPQTVEIDKSYSQAWNSLQTFFFFHFPQLKIFSCKKIISCQYAGEVVVIFGDYACSSLITWQSPSISVLIVISTSAFLGLCSWWK